MQPATSNVKSNIYTTHKIVSFSSSSTKQFNLNSKTKKLLKTKQIANDKLLRIKSAQSKRKSSKTPKISSKPQKSRRTRKKYLKNQLLSKRSRKYPKVMTRRQKRQFDNVVNTGVLSQLEHYYVHILFDNSIKICVFIWKITI